jgi:hypothetical protein
MPRPLYPALMSFDPAAAGLSAQSGVFAIWHLGVRPQWLKVGATLDLAATVAAAKRAPRIRKFERNGGLYLRWMLGPAAAILEWAAFLRATLKPVAEAVLDASELKVDSATKPIECPPLPGAAQPLGRGGR